VLETRVTNEPAVSLIIRGIGLLPRTWIKTASSLQWRHPLAKSAFDAVSDRFRHRDGVIRQGAGKGLHFNTGASVAGFMLGTTEPGLQTAFELFVRPKMTVFDIGANVGFYSTISARIVGPEGLVVAFEPLPSNVRMVFHNAALNLFRHISVQEVALGREDGRATFIISSEPGWGRLASTGVPAGVIGKHDVRIARLDSLIRQGTVPRPDLMKIDVEGAESDVLEGAEETLKTARPILFIDLHKTNEPIARILEQHDYEARVLGGGRSTLTEAKGNAEVIAVPRERTDLFEHLDRMARWSIT
jgi:FkbM family methyltransferase